METLFLWTQILKEDKKAQNIKFFSNAPNEYPSYEEPIREVTPIEAEVFPLTFQETAEILHFQS